MARPLKKGLDYFPLQTDIFTTSSELAPLLNRFDGYGLLVYLHILCDIYSNGYYLKVPFMEDYKASIRKSINCPEDVVTGVIDLLKRLKILTFIDEKEYVVITSKGIQKRYLEVVKDRKRSLENLLKKFKNEYWLLSDDEVFEKCSKLTENVNSDVKRGFSGEKLPFSGEKQGFSGDKAEIKCINKGLLSFPLNSLENESIDVNKKQGVTGKLSNSDVDEFDREIEQEKESKKLQQTLGLTPKLERLGKGEKAESASEDAPHEFDAVAYNRFTERWGITITDVANYSGVIYEIDWDALTGAIIKSKWLQGRLKNPSAMEFLLRNYYRIMNGYYEDFKSKRQNGFDILNEIAEEMRESENGDEK